MFGIHKQRILLMFLALFGCVAIFFPWVKNTNNTSTIGINTGIISWVALIALLSVIIVCTYGTKEKQLEGWQQYCTIGLSAITAIIGIFKVLHIIGIGLIIVQLCSIACVFIALNISRKKNDGISEINKIENL